MKWDAYANQWIETTKINMRGGCRCTKQICNKYANSILLIRLPGEKKIVYTDQNE